MPDALPYPDSIQLGAYFGLMEVTALLEHAVEQQLREDGDLSYVQFQILARLVLDSPTGSWRMTELADSLVCSRSGLTYQAGQLEQAGLVVRSPSPDDDRGVMVTVTEDGRALLNRVLPGHLEVVDRLLYTPLKRSELKALGALLGPVRDHMRAAPPRSAAPRRRGETRAAGRK